MNRRDAMAAGLLVLVVSAAAGAFVLWQAPRMYGELQEQPRVAAHLARGHGFLSPLDPSPQAEPSNWLPPGYPLLMAGVYRLLGIETPAALNVMLLINAVGLGLAVAGAYLLATRLAGRLAGGLAAAMVFAYPAFLIRALHFWDTHVALAMFAGLTLAALTIAQTRATTGRLLMLGAGLGLLILTNVAYVLACPVLVLLAVRVQPWRRQAILAGLALAAFLVVLTPWTVRNYLRFDRLMLVRGGAYLEIWVGNQPGQTGWMDLVGHPNVDPAEREVFLAMGEQAYWQLCRERFHADYQADPRAFWLRTANRAGMLLIGPVRGGSIPLLQPGGMARTIRVVMDSTVSLLAIAGFLIAWRRGVRMGWWPPLVLAVVVPYLVTHVSYRYLIPMKWLLLVVAAVALAAAIQTLAARLRRPIPQSAV